MPVVLLVIRLTPAPVTEPVWKLGATLLPSTTRSPPLAVIEAAPPPPATAPVTFSPLVLPLSFRVKPVAAVNRPRLAMLLVALPRLAAPAELPVRVPVVAT